MTTRMLIDARHREETRVAVVKSNRIEEFDFESAERKQLKGNIYLAKVTRVEPSLQAAFIDYGGNRHGFLAFSEIHPDYYQIPKEDREALLREEAEFVAEEAALREAEGDDDLDDDRDDVEDHDGDDHDGDDAEPTGEEGDAPAPRARRSGGGDDGVEALRERRQSLRRRYKIQDVIRRRQVLLVQVVKEERGNKGAALTTYLSLAGRYCVLMPNTSHGGGISRKISNAADRKRLKSIMADLKLPPSMGCIVRTAGLQRTKVEIKRDFDYLARLWDGIREKTIESAAPALVYGDSDLIKRAIRDIYNKDVDEIIVEGEEGYRQAKEFMRLLMPSHARRVRHYSDAVPLYQRCQVEDQLAAMYHPVVQLKSGGYLVINPTEALVSIDINSGRSTREHNIEQTATATNLEAAQEIGRQLRLRDMAGLVVIDFIDMDNSSNVRKVEKAMKEALKNDRARIQVGRISSFGLMEMSRQRIRTGVLEASTRGCPHCEGTGLVRTASSAGLSALRLIEDEAARGRGSVLTLRASQEAAVYVLNRKRADIAEIEDRYGVQVEIFPDRDEEGARMSVEASGPPPAYAPKIMAPIEEIEDDVADEIEPEEDEIEVAEDEAADEAPRAERPERAERAADGEGRGRGRRRRRGRRNRRPEDETQDGAQDGAPVDGDAELDGDVDADDVADIAPVEAEPVEAESVEAGGEQAPATDDDAVEGDSRRRRGRRGRRGGRRGRDETAGTDAAEPLDATDVEPVAAEPVAPAPVAPEPVMAEPEPELALPAEPVDEAPAEPDAPRPRRRPRARKSEAAAPVEAVTEATVEAAVAEPTPAAIVAPTEAPADVPADADVPAKPKRSRRKAADAVAEPVAAPADEATAPKRRPRRKAADAPVAEVAEPELPAIAEATAAAPAEPTPVAASPAADADAAPAAADADGADGADGSGDTPRRGWWQRTFGA